MRVGSRHPTHRKPHSPACACDQASELSADHVLKHLAIKRQVGNNLLQLRVVIFKLLQPPHLRRLHAIVALLPIEVGCRADTGLAADVRHRHPVAALLQNEAFCDSENLNAFIVFRSSQPGNQTRKTLAKNGPVYWEQISKFHRVTRKKEWAPDSAEINHIRTL